MAARAAVAPARRAAYEVVLRVFEDDAYADRAFTTAAGGLDARDRALAQQIAYGTVQRVRTLDHAIEALGRRPVRKLDPPVRAALRLGAYQLGYLDGVPAHAAVNESVELVRAARLERAVPFTNAVLRRLTEGLRALLASLPEGPLKHSYPDWIYETWRRDWGEDEALALMRAQNEAPETVVRLVRGEIEGEPTDVPGAWRVARVDEGALAEGRIWPQSRGSQLAGLAVGSRRGERVLDLCAAPGGKATMLAGEVVAVELHEGRARELEENVHRLGATNVRVVKCRRPRAAARTEGLRPRAGRCAVLRPGRAGRAAGPALARTGPAGAPARLAAGSGSAREARRHGHLLGLHAEHRRERGGRPGVRPRRRGPGRGVARIPPPEATGVPAHDTPSPRDLRVLRRAASGLSLWRNRHAIVTPQSQRLGGKRHERRSRKIGSVGWDDWIRTVEVEPSLYAADFSQLGHDLDVLLRAGARIVHFDVGDAHFVEPVTMGPIVLESIAPLVHEAGGVVDCHLMVDDPVHHFAAFEAAGADSVTFHVEAADDPAAVAAKARDHGFQVGLAFNPETPVDEVVPLAHAFDLVLCMSIHPGYSGQEFMPEAVGRIEQLRSLVPAHVHVQVDGGISHENVRSVYDAGADLIVAGSAIFGREDLPRAYRRLVQALA